jgi:arginyl-tRNA synthetase
MKQMFAVCEQLGIGKVEEFCHVPYGYMTLKGQGKMSSRLGNVVFIDQLLDLVKERVMEKIADRDFSVEEKEVVAEKLAVGAVKYSILKMGRMTDMAFDLETSVSFDGDSAPYLNYVYVRTQSLLNKVENWNSESVVQTESLNEEEISLLRWIYKYGEVVERAGIDMSPNLICSYLLELSQRFNAFYGKHSILGEEDKKDFRLKLAYSVGTIIKNGLGIIGITVVERM